MQSFHGVFTWFLTYQLCKNSVDMIQTYEQQFYLIIWDKWLNLDKFVMGYKRVIWGKTLEMCIKKKILKKFHGHLQVSCTEVCVNKQHKIGCKI